MDLTGRTLGDFILEKKLGAGGMGEVYRARQASLDRVVAVKVLPKALASQEGFEERFRREARAAANLIHPNVIQVYFVGVDPETKIPYFAMEFVEGEDLQQRMRRMRSLPYEMSVEILAGVVSALACAQDKGIVHRDIKPSNIMIDGTEVVKVMDFGLAKATRDKHSSNLTQSGIILGTPNYISPEAGRGDPIDGRSDIYSLGVVFFELLTGSLPFTAETPAAIIFKHVYEPPPPPRGVNPDCPPFLEEICLRMIAKDPKDRYPNAKALLADLNECKRNLAHYMGGGARRAPDVGTASRAGETTVADSGSFMGRAKSGVTPREGEVTAAQPPPTVASAPARRSRAAEMIAGAVIVLVAGGAGAALFWPAGPAVPQAGGVVTGTGAGTTAAANPVATPASGAPVAFPASKLERLRRGGVDAFIQEGFSQRPLPAFDVQVPAGDYTLVFAKAGYEPITRTFRVAAEGVSPPLEDLKLEFRPSEELRRTVEAGKRAIEERKFREAISLLQAVVDKTPDYEPAVVALGTAKQQQGLLREDVQRAERLYNERRWAEAIEAFRALPATIEQPEAVASMVGMAELSLTRVKEHLATFERHMQAGLLPEANATIDEVEKLLPARDAQVKQLQERVQEANRLYELGRTAYDAGHWEEALKQLDAFLKVAPGHREGGALASRARGELDKRLSATQKVESALKAAEAAFAAGQHEAAIQEAQRALAIDPQSAGARDVLARARQKVGENEIVARIAALDASFVRASQGSGESRYALLEMIDPSAREAVRADLDGFATSGIEVRESARRELAVTLGEGGGTAVVECAWSVVLGFPMVEGAVPPARGRVTRLAVRQRIGLRRVGEAWLFTSFEQIGLANVQ